MQQTPFPQLFMIILFVILFIFLATTVDSSALAAAEMTVLQENFVDSDTSTPKWLRVLWALITAIIAFIIVRIGGAKTVRALCYSAGLPLAIVAILVIISAIKMIKSDYSDNHFETIKDASEIVEVKEE